MPTYEYACRACGEHLEVVQSFKDDPLTECPNCGGDLRKVFSAAGLIFKGSGWHIKDYSSSSKKPASSGKDSSSDGGKDSSPDSTSKSDTSKSDTKTESTSSAKSETSAKSA